LLATTEQIAFAHNQQIFLKKEKGAFNRRERRVFAEIAEKSSWDYWHTSSTTVGRVSRRIMLGFLSDLCGISAISAISAVKGFCEFAVCDYSHRVYSFWESDSRRCKELLERELDAVRRCYRALALTLDNFCSVSRSNRIPRSARSEI
jgi:hypothetical protein